MYLALVFYPKIELDHFNVLRRKYDPYANLMKEHMPFVFPLDQKIGLAAFKAHVRSVLEGWSPFDIHLCNLRKTPDHWLMLTLEEGRKESIRLHNALYTGILAPYLRYDLPYEPHISLGHFGNEKWELENPLKTIDLDMPKYEKAMSEFKSLDLDMWRKVDQLTILGLDHALRKCTDLVTVELGI